MVVVKLEPEAETTAVRSEVVMGLLEALLEVAPPAMPPMPKMVVWPVVVVKLEPEAETMAVRSEVVMALLEVALPLWLAPPAVPLVTVELQNGVRAVEMICSGCAGVLT